MAFTELKKKHGAYRVNVSPNVYHRLSLWTHAEDVEFDDGSFLKEKFDYASGVLQAGETSVTINSDLITADGMLDIYVPNAYCKLSPDSITQTNGSVTITFPAQSANVEVRVRCT